MGWILEVLVNLHVACNCMTFLTLQMFFPRVFVPREDRDFFEKVGESVKNCKTKVVDDIERNTILPLGL
jgi:hypothetical protein